MDRYKEFTTLFNKISRNIRKIKDVEMAKFDLKSSHMTCLYYLYKENKMTSKELCDVCAEDKAVISKTLSLLEEKGFVKCLDEVKKRYNSDFILTEKGLVVGKIVVEKVDEMIKVICEGIEFSDLTIFYQGLLKISNNLEDVYQERYGNKL
ncbi:MAG: winged helix-turn-helix transcriptional regulator [Bacilli bacterium]|nr:winged helix-turn-helix transcriptional regulator [Bacilli bacterium]